MKKLLISILIAVTACGTVWVVLRGIHIGNFAILGMREIKAEDTELEEKITEATELVSSKYPNTISKINNDIKKMKAEKQKYDDMVVTSTESEIATAIQSQNYTIDKLWARIGTLATDEGLDAKFVLKKGTLEAAEGDNFDYYTIEFEVTGSYVGVSLYVSDLEEDSELGFKIENFKMVPVDGGANVKATFVTNDIAIQGIKEMEEKAETDEAKEEGEENKNNTTNTNETQKETNTTNTVKSTNTVKE